MKYLLHIDTSADTGSISLGCDGALLSTKTNSEARNHASAINLMIDAVLADGGITMQQLNAIVVCAGPGSYTGLRIGMATAKGLCYALNIPLLLDNKLTLLAYQAYRKYGGKYEQYLPILLARDKEYFISKFDNSFKNTSAATHIIDTQLTDYVNTETATCIISECVFKEVDLINADNIYIEPIISIDLNEWIFYAFKEYKCNNIVNLSTAEPFYLKQVYTHK